MNQYDSKEMDAVRPKTDVELSEELEHIASAAAERLRALVDGDAEREVELQRRVGEAASRGIAAGLSLARSRTPSRSAKGERARGWACSFCGG